jgi:glucosamine--fructose-6-phosphate aminotransferase (isomerizing)
VFLDGIGLSDTKIRSIKHITIVACGTAYHAGLVGKYIIESLAKIPVTVDAASEFRYRNPIIDKNSLMIPVSQSGETADTLAAVREAKRKGAKIVSICNVIGSSLARESDGILYTHAGPEIGVASTKAYTAQLCMFYLLALKLASANHALSKKESAKLIKNLKEIPNLYRRILENKNSIANTGRANSHFGCFLFLGRNINYPNALEGALKLKEISYIPAEGYAAGEMKHGPIALIDEYRAVVCIATQSETYEKMVSNIQEIKARRGKVIAIATEGDEAIKRYAHYVVYVPKTNNLLTPLLSVLPLQLIAYYIAVKRGCDVDQPRNLAKSVTVE